MLSPKKDVVKAFNEVIGEGKSFCYLSNKHKRAIRARKNMTAKRMQRKSVTELGIKKALLTQQPT